MVRRLLLSILILSVSATALPVEAARRVTIKKYYEGSFVLWNRIGRSDVTCNGEQRPCTLTKDGYIDIGAVTFDPIGGRKRKYDVTIRVRDEYEPWGKVAMSACEDTNRNGSCSTTGGDRLWTNTCLSRNEKLVLRGVLRSRPIRVTIQQAYSCTQFINDIPEEQGGGTTGVVLLSYYK